MKTDKSLYLCNHFLKTRQIVRSKLYSIYFMVQEVTRLQAKGIGTVCGKLLIGTAEKIPQSELVDTTGAGDAFIGAVLYGTYL